MVALAESIVALPQIQSIEPMEELLFRIYGGWFEGTSATRRSTTVAGEVASLARVTSLPGKKGARPVRIRGELALGPLDEPRVFFTHTYRRRTQPESLVCEGDAIRSCIHKAHCRLVGLPELVRTGQCPEPGCEAQCANILKRDEQKLVDTHLITDLLAMSRRGEQYAVVVSTDDDMWPGIRSALLSGVKVVHLHPKPGRSTPTHYLVSLPPGYTQHTLL